MHKFLRNITTTKKARLKNGVVPELIWNYPKVHKTEFRLGIRDNALRKPKHSQMSYSFRSGGRYMNQHQPSSSGFSLIEIMVVVALVGVLISMIIPRLTRRSPSSEWKTILSEFNNLTLLARQESIAEQTIFRLKFSRNNFPAVDTITVERLSKTSPDGKQEFVQASSPYLATKYELSEAIRFRAIFQGKQNLLQENNEAFCYVIPDGLVQDIYVQLIRTENLKEEFATLKMLPFDGYFELVEKLIRPGQENT